MKLGSFDYFTSLRGLLKQIFAWRRYKTLPVWACILCGILMIPSVLIAALGIILYVVLYVMYRCVTAPLTYLHTVVYDEGQDVKHASQAIIYLVSWPILFILYAFVAIIAFFFAVDFFIISVFSYLFTLGGVQFLPFVLDQDKRNLSEEWLTAKWDRTKAPIYIVFIVIGYALLFFTILGLGIYYLGANAYIEMEVDAIDTFYYLGMISLILKELFKVCYVLIAWHKQPQLPAPENK